MYANINSAYDLDRGQNNILKRPFRIEIEKTNVIANYRVYYRGVSKAKVSNHLNFNNTPPPPLSRLILFQRSTLLYFLRINAAIIGSRSTILVENTKTKQAMLYLTAR